MDRKRRPRREIRDERLAEILRGELLPRLLSRPGVAGEERWRSAVRADPEALALNLVSGRTPQARAAIAARLRSGATPTKVLLEDLAPAARQLGELWSRDACDFFDVTAATQILREMLRDLAPVQSGMRAEAGSLIVSPAPGETHEFGADIAAAVFRFAGWRAVRTRSGDINACLASEWFDAVGFSLSCDRHIDALRSAIRAAREASCNRRLTILLGGPVFAACPGLGERLGADVCASLRDLAEGFPQTILRLKQL